MSNKYFTCPNCHKELIVDNEPIDDFTDCYNCGAKVSIIPTFRRNAPEISVNARLAFAGIIVIVTFVGAIGACMLMAGWNFWVTSALIGGMLYLIEMIFLGKYTLTKIEDDIDQEMMGVYVSHDGEVFNELVNKAIDELPDKFKNKLKGINIVVEDVPGNDTVKKLGIRSNRSLAGLYQGIPLTHRSVWHGNRLPDKITIFKKNIESYCKSDATLKREIKRVVRHELGHFFGLNEDELRKIEGREL
ncbi:MAG: metallopeptidase family protein [Candidatus Anammoxibacter sp.]